MSDEIPPDHDEPLAPVVPFEALPPAGGKVEDNPSTPAKSSAPTADNPAPGPAAPPPLVVDESEKMLSRPSPTPPASTAAGGDLSAAFTTIAGEHEYHFDESTRSYWLKNEAGDWIDLGDAGFKRHLKKLHGLRDKPGPNQVISPMDERLSEIEQDHRVASAGLFAGWRAGVHSIAGRSILVVQDPVIIEPVRGEWPILAQFFAGLLVGEEPIDDKGTMQTIDQRPWFFGWLQQTVRCYNEGRRESGLALCMAGEPNSGKSFLALILRWILGGRVARPYDAMIGKDNFNRDLAEAVLQLVDDDNQSDTRLEARLKFAGELKKIVANNEFKLRAMHRDGFAIEVLRRLVVLVNLQASRLMVLPPLDGDVNDKLLLFKGYARPRPAVPITEETPAADACWPAPMPTRNDAEKAAYRAAVRAELPAFLFWLLNEFKMPSQITGGRFTVRHYHHPAIVQELHELSPHLRIWDLILRSKVVLQHYETGDGTTPAERRWRESWSGSASDLERLLTGETSALTLDEKREVPKPTWLGQRLDSIREHFGEEICRFTRKAGGRIWTIKPRKEDREAQA